MEAPNPIGLLYDHQVEHTLTLENCLNNRQAALDASDTGMGKTVVWCVIAARANRKLFVISPKPVVGAWFQTAAFTGVDIIGVANYEIAKLGKYYTSEKQFMSGDAIACPYMTFPGLKKTVETLVFDFPEDALIVVDEAHRGKNNRTHTATLLKRIRMTLKPGTRMAVLSATITDSIEDFRMTAFVIGAAQYEIHPYKAWIRSIRIAGEPISACIHKAIFPAYGSRMRRDTIKANESMALSTINSKQYQIHEHMFMWMKSMTPGQSVCIDIYVNIIDMYDCCKMFRDSKVRAVVYEVSPEVEAEITNAYADMADAIDALRNQQMGEIHPLTIILRARQRLEMLKSQTMIDQAMDYIMAGFAVVLFVNFTPTVKRMVDQLGHFMATEMVFEDDNGAAYYKPAISVICGGQSSAERNRNMEQFQNGESLVCVVNIQAGGIGIGLHHKMRSSKPRKTLFSPPWSAIVLAQGLGRVDRVGALSDSEQIIVYCKGSVAAVDATGAGDGTFNNGTARVNIEEIMAANINTKLELIGMLNDGDLDGLTKI